MIKRLFWCGCSDNFGGGSLLIARVIIGIIFLAHGYQKMTMGVDAVGGFFLLVGIPFPVFFAYFITYFELIGGALLIVGFFTHWVAKLFAIEMVVAFFTVHITEGIFVSQGGFELVAALFAVLVILMASGPGRFAIDNLIKKNPT